MRFRVHSTRYGVRGPHNFLGASVAQQPLPSLVLKLLLQLTQWRRNVSFKSGTARNAFCRPTFWPNERNLVSNFSGISLKLMPPDALICTKVKKVEWNGNHSVSNGPVKRLTNSACLQVYMSDDHANFRTYFTKKLSAPTGSFTV